MSHQTPPKSIIFLLHESINFRNIMRMHNQWARYEVANPINYYSMAIIMIITWAQLCSKAWERESTNSGRWNWIKFLIPFHQHNCYCSLFGVAHAARNYWVDVATCFRSHMSFECILILIGFQFLPLQTIARLYENGKWNDSNSPTGNGPRNETLSARQS